MSGIFDAGVNCNHPELGPVLAKYWGGELWFFREQPDGQHLTVRKCNDDDRELLSTLLHAEHGPVMMKG